MQTATAPQVAPETIEGAFKYPGGELLFRLFNNEVCIRISEEILAGHTYPEVSFVSGVRTILDIGANIGAAAVWLGTTYPSATVYALEPGSRQFGLLQQNASSLANLRLFPFGSFPPIETCRFIRDAMTAWSLRSVRRVGLPRKARTLRFDLPRSFFPSRGSTRSTFSSSIPRAARFPSFAL